MNALLAASRPRFWLYLLGPALVGIAASAQPAAHAMDPRIIALLLVWTLPANLFLYGVNDLMDADTDEFNEKKDSYEQRLRASHRPRLRAAVCLSAAMILAAALLTDSAAARLAVVLFVVLGFTYSAPPTRWKARPALDSLSNVLYIMPGIALAAACGVRIEPAAVLGAWAWSSAMHLFSAIPDIQADARAHLRTTAVVLGARRSLACCAVLWGMAACAAFWIAGPHVVPLAAAAYALLPLALLRSGEGAVFAVYRRMPLLNAVAGAVLFFTALL